MYNRKIYCYLFILVCFCIIIILGPITIIIALTIYDLTPSPTFTIHDVKFSTFNLSSTLTSNLQLTISAKNDANGFHFEKIDVYASYRNQQITPPTVLPPTYLGSHDVMDWSLSLNGTDVPLSPDLGLYLVQDVTVGNVLVNVEVTGQLRSKWASLSRQYRLKVNCREYIVFGNGSDIIGSAFGEGCHVRVKPLQSAMKVFTSSFHK